MVDREKCRRDRHLSEQHRHQPDLRASARKGAAVSSRRSPAKTAVHLAHKVEEGVKNLARAERDFRRARAALLRADRRTRHSAAHPHFRISEDAGRAGPAPHPDEKRQRLRTGDREAGQVSRARKIHRRDRRDRGRGRRRPTRRFSARRWRNLPTPTSKIVAITGAMPSGTGLGFFQATASRSLLTTSASRRNTPRSSPAAWRRRG